MDPPGTRYVERDGHALAYQVVGEGGVDVVLYLEMGLHPDLMWTDPHINHLFERATTFGRSACFQRRGGGGGAPPPPPPPHPGQGHARRPGQVAGGGVRA
ncbi:hypothetical protein ACFWPB_06970, partial [Rhodococcus sp. NPDC058514]